MYLNLTPHPAHIFTVLFMGQCPVLIKLVIRWKCYHTLMLLGVEGLPGKNCTKHDRLEDCEQDCCGLGEESMHISGCLELVVWSMVK